MFITWPRRDPPAESSVGTENGERRVLGSWQSKAKLSTAQLQARASFEPKAKAQTRRPKQNIGRHALPTRGGGGAVGKRSRLGRRGTAVGLHGKPALWSQIANGLGDEPR